MREPKVVFCIPLHPKTEEAFPSRMNLFRCCLEHLEEQIYRNWHAYLVGRVHPALQLDSLRITVVPWTPPTKPTPTREHPDVGDKVDRLRAAVAAADLDGGGHWIARLDDDDQIGRDSLHFLHSTGRLSEESVHGWCDDYHLFYDLDTERYFQMRRPWTQNTVLMRYSIAKNHIGDHHADFGRRLIPASSWGKLPPGLPLYCKTLHAKSVTGWTLADREKISALSKYEPILLDGPPPGFTEPEPLAG